MKVDSQVRSHASSIKHLADLGMTDKLNDENCRSQAWRTTMKRILILTLILLLPINSFAATLEVGSGKPYTTIQAAVDVATAGDTVLVYAGTYNQSNSYSYGGTRTTIVHIKNSGTSSNPLIIKAVDSNVTLDGGGTINNCFWGRDLSYVVIDGFKCTNVNVESPTSASGAVHFWLSSYITIQNMNIYNIIASDTENKAAIMANMSDSVIKSNTIIVNSVGIAGGMSGYLFERNIIENNIINGNSLASGTYFSQNANDYVIRNNYIYNYGLAGIQMRDSYGAKIYNNIVYGGHGPGGSGQSYAMNLRDWSTAGPGLQDENEQYKVWNNIVDTCSYGYALTRINNTEFKNNIVSNCSTAYVDTEWYSVSHGEPSQNLLFDYNIYFNYSNLYEGFNDTGYGAVTYTDGGHNLYNIDPKFVGTGNRPSPYYKLQAGSQAINSGDPSFKVPPTWGVVDIGRYEWTSSGLMPNEPTGLKVQ